MGWIWQVPPPHECPLPAARFTSKIGPGSRWECDECHRHWILVTGTGGLPVWANPTYANVERHSG